MTFRESLPIARSLAEKSLQKGFDFEAFMVLCELEKLDKIPESDIDEHITDIGRIFIDYYYNPTSEALNNLLNKFINTISEIYNSIYDSSDKELFRNKIQSLIDIIK